MPASNYAVRERMPEPLTSINDKASPAGQGPQFASFLLEVRNRAHVTRELVERINTIMTEGGFEVTLTPTQSANVPLAKPDPGVPSAPVRAAMRGEARLVSWTQDGTLVEGSKIEQAWGVKRQTVDAARRRGELFSVWVKGMHWYPGEALKLERAALAKINGALGDTEPSSKLLFLLRKHGALGGQTPADAVAGGKFDEVIRIATDWAHT